MSKIKGLVTSICFYLSGRGSQSDQMGHAAGGGTLWRKNASGFLIQVGRGGDGILLKWARRAGIFCFVLSFNTRKILISVESNVNAREEELSGEFVIVL